MPLESPAYVISADSHSAALFRLAAQSMISGCGVTESGSLAVSQNGTPNMSVNVAAGMIWMPGTLGATTGFGNNTGAQTAYGLPSSKTSQGSYGAYNDATVNLAISAADPTNPRIDLVVASVQDAQYSGSNNQPVLQVITGTAAPSPSAPSAPASSVVLAQVAVAAGASSIVTANITDKRPIFGLNGGIIRAASSAQYPANPVTGDYVDNAALNALMRYNGSAWVPASGGWQAYTPTLSGSTTSPTVGTGGILQGVYTDDGQTVSFVARVLFGTSPSPGSGFFALSLPAVASPSMPSTVFPAMYFANATHYSYSFSAELQYNTNSMVFRRGDGSGNTWGSAYPAAPAANDYFYVSGTYWRA